MPQRVVVGVGIVAVVLAILMISFWARSSNSNSTSTVVGTATADTDAVIGIVPRCTIVFDGNVPPPAEITGGDCAHGDRPYQEGTVTGAVVHSRFEIDVRRPDGSTYIAELPVSRTDVRVGDRWTGNP